MYKYILNFYTIALFKTSFLLSIFVWIYIFNSNLQNTNITISGIVLLFSIGVVCLWYLLCLGIDLNLPKFDLTKHSALVSQFTNNIIPPTVDIFLPVCGEDLKILNNTWQGVSNLKYGPFKVYVLDDKGDKKVEDLALEYGFNYLSRPNRGEMKKAGNLKYGYEKSQGEYIVIFDADFRPVPEFLANTIPYLVDDKNIAIVQTPQKFEEKHVNLLAFGASNIQEFFYKIVQPARNRLGGAICVGTNAVYRRAALATIGGTAQIEHSEDVWTGFKLISKGFKLLYIPIILAKGLCPDNPSALFKQQTRWCQGSMSLMVSKEFWQSPVSWFTKSCYISGFLYYISNFFTLILPLASLVVALESQASDFAISPVILILRGLFLFITLYVVIFPKANLGTVVALCIACWAYSYTLINLLLGREEKWEPSGSVKKVKSFEIVRIVHLIYTAIYGVLYFFAVSQDKLNLVNGLWLTLNLVINIILVYYFFFKNQ